MMEIKFDQIAMYTRDVSPESIMATLEPFGATEWVEDVVEAEGMVYGQRVRNKAHLFFNYQLGDFEFEILQYVSGQSWLDRRPTVGGMSHMGAHVEDMLEHKRFYEGQGLEIAQEVITQSHTNPAIADSRRYHYVIFDTYRKLGYDIKLIERLPV